MTRRHGSGGDKGLTHHAASPRLHLFNGFRSPYGGSELETLDLYRDLSSLTDTTLWATSSRAHETLLDGFNVRRARALPGHWPDGGHYIFAGAHWRGKLWPHLATPPERLIYIYNTFHPKLLRLTAKVPPRWPRPEYVAISQFQCRHLGIEAEVHPSPIDLTRFTPPAERAPGPLRIGRMSRDTPEKHHCEDMTVYRALASLGVECRLQGASCLQGSEGFPGVHLGPAGECDAAEFLRQLDIFYYRTGEHLETFGRVVFEAMACGLPVLCHRRGGYVDWIEHGRNGLLFDTTEEALALLKALLDDPGERLRLGRAARETVEALYSPAAKRERLRFYTGPATVRMG